MKHPDHLDPSKGEDKRLAEALALNEPLACAYYLKEDLLHIWLQPNKELAKAALDEWIKKAKASGINVLMKFANTLAGYKSGILAYYDFRISSAALEGTNNKIKTMKKMAYGFRDLQFFKLKIMALHEVRFGRMNQFFEVSATTIPVHAGDTLRGPGISRRQASLHWLHYGENRWLHYADH